jgi:hypothetical protein
VMVVNQAEHFEPGRLWCTAVAEKFTKKCTLKFNLCETNCTARLSKFNKSIKFL